MKGDRLRTGNIQKTLEELAKQSEYAIVGPTGLYLRTLPHLKKDLSVFSPLYEVDVVGNVAAGNRPDLSSISLPGFEKGFIAYASPVKFDGNKVRVASPSYLVLEYLMRGRAISDVCAFVKAGGDIEAEQLRNMLKGIKRTDLFADIPSLLYDFSPSRVAVRAKYA